MAKGITPNSKPQMTRAEFEQLVAANFDADIIDYKKPVLVGIRGYYRKSFGNPNKNDIGVYDDAIALLTPLGFMTFNANMDPGEEKKGSPTLLPGCYWYEIGIHNQSKEKSKQYRALVQQAHVSVKRVGQGLDIGFFGINIHRGGVNVVGSAGCQTIHPSQWDDFFRAVEIALSISNVKKIQYFVIEVKEA